MSGWRLSRKPDGRISEEADRYEEVARQCERQGLAVDRADALLRAGRCLLEVGQVPVAIAGLEEALKLFRNFGAQPLVEETEAYLHRAGASLASDPPGA